MQILALCAQSYSDSVRRAAGVEPVSFPPMTIDSLVASMLEGYDLIYLKFHGLPQQPFLYTDRYVTAISSDQLASADFKGALVFAAVCHLPQSPLLSTLLQAGARGVVAGDGINYGSLSRFYGADLLGFYFRRFLVLNFSPERALSLSRLVMRLRRPRSLQEKIVLDDTLAFRFFTSADEGMLLSPFFKNVSNNQDLVDRPPFVFTKEHEL